MLPSRPSYRTTVSLKPRSWRTYRTAGFYLRPRPCFFVADARQTLGGKLFEKVVYLVLLGYLHTGYSLLNSGESDLSSRPVLSATLVQFCPSVVAWFASFPKNAKSGIYITYADAFHSQQNVCVCSNRATEAPRSVFVILQTDATAGIFFIKQLCFIRPCQRVHNRHAKVHPREPELTAPLVPNPQSWMPCEQTK